MEGARREPKPAPPATAADADAREADAVVRFFQSILRVPGKARRPGGRGPDKPKPEAEPEATPAAEPDPTPEAPK